MKENRSFLRIDFLDFGKESSYRLILGFINLLVLGIIMLCFFRVGGEY